MSLYSQEFCCIWFYHLCQFLYRNYHSITKKSRAISCHSLFPAWCVLRESSFTSNQFFVLNLDDWFDVLSNKFAIFDIPLLYLNSSIIASSITRTSFFLFSVCLLICTLWKDLYEKLIVLHNGYNTFLFWNLYQINTFSNNLNDEERLICEIHYKATFL